jgi:hypothetical protein
VTRDLIRKLKYPQAEARDETSYATRSDKMAKIAKEHHDKMQEADTNGPLHERERLIQSTLNAIDSKLTEEERTALDCNLSEDNITSTLTSTANGKAPRLDGYPYELWKTLYKRNQDLESQEKEGFDIIRTLKTIFNNIERNGIPEASNFSKGWMCPIYKKGEKTEIANYRPITVLNTDYKLFTKGIQAKLAPVAQNLIHSNQAGFMKNQSILNHIHTLCEPKPVVNYCDKYSK